jgi:hypothetical protein
VNGNTIYQTQKPLLLEAEYLVLELGHRLGRLETELDGSLLHRADHGRRTADEELDVRCSLRTPLLYHFISTLRICHGKMSGTYINHIGGDESLATRPSLRRVVQHVVDTEVRVGFGKFIQVILQEDILVVDVGKDQINLSLVLGVVGDGAHNLEHGGDSSSSGNHGESADHVGGVDELTLGTTDADGLADFQVRDVLRDVTGGVGLDQEVEVAEVHVRRGGSVRAHDFLAVDVGGD